MKHEKNSNRVHFWHVRRSVMECHLIACLTLRRMEVAPGWSVAAAVLLLAGLVI